MNLTPRGHHRQPTAGIFQLPDVARPRQRREILLGLRVQRFHFSAELLSGFCEKVARQQADIHPAIGESGQVNSDHVESMVEVLPKRTGCNQCFEVLMRSGDDTHIHMHRFTPADSIERAIGKHAQQASLGVGRHIADLVEKQGAPIGLFEPADAFLAGTCKGAFFMTEQLGLNQVFRDGGHVQGDARRAGARAVPMQCARNQFLAGAGGAVDQDGDVRM